MALRVMFSKEERDLDKNDTLDMLFAGTVQAEIARQLGRSTQYISNLKGELISEGLITQEQIDAAREKARAEKEARNKKPNTVLEKSIARKNAIVARVKNRENIILVRRELGIPINSMKRYVAELIAEGRITEEEIIREVPSQKGKKRKKQKAESLTDTEKAILGYLHFGYLYGYIATLTGLTQEEVVKVVGILKAKKVIDSQAIKDARDQKAAGDEDEVHGFLMRGFKAGDILSKKKELNRASLWRIIDRLKNDNRITNEQIAIARANDEDRLYLEGLVFEGLQKGFTVRQIIESDETRICY